ncbi:hypothetical protein PQX77_002909 [Marasmius sp. AFHP31]|nr:hypothetical protein PQX77_002909 [Marasmius sp. AFHP31]
MNPTTLGIPKQFADDAEELQDLLRHRPTLQPEDVLVCLGRFEDNVSQIDTELHRLRLEINLPEEKHQWMARYVKAGRSLLAPICTLPAELLQHIFQLCCEDGISIIVRQGHHATPQPIVLSRVCNLWWGLTTSLPNLWSTLRYEIYRNESVEEGDRCRRITDLFLQRAQHAPLALSFNVPQLMENITHMEPTLDKLCRHAAQWTSVSLAIPSVFLQQPVFYSLKGKLQNLRMIRFLEYAHHDLGKFLSILDFLGPCPALRVADLDFCIDRTPDRLPAIPWSQLTSLVLAPCSGTPSLSYIIPLCHNLTSLTVEVHGHWTETSRDIRTMTTLRSLTVNAVRRQSPVFQEFFQRFTFPNLQFLGMSNAINSYGSVKAEEILSNVINSYGSVEKEEMSAVIECLRRSSCPLHSLFLDNCPFDVEQVVQLFQNLPHLSSLHLREIPGYFQDDLIYTPHLFRRLGFEQSRPPLLPHLTKLKLTVNVNTLPNSDALFEVVTSRRNPGFTTAAPDVERLQVLEATFLNKERTPPLVPKGLERLESLREGGLKVIIFLGVQRRFW